MDLITALSILVQLIMGLVLGFILNDGKKTIGLGEILAGTGILAIALLVMVVKDMLTASSFIALFITWLFIWGGLILGNILRGKLIDHLVAGYQTKQLKSIITGLLYSLRHSRQHGDTLHYTRISKLERAIEGVELTLTKLGADPEIMSYYKNLKEMCSEYAKAISEGISEADSRRLEDDIMDIARDISQHTTEVIHNSMHRLWTTRILWLHITNQTIRRY